MTALRSVSMADKYVVAELSHPSENPAFCQVLDAKQYKTNLSVCSMTHMQWGLKEAKTDMVGESTGSGRGSEYLCLGRVSLPSLSRLPPLRQDMCKLPGLRLKLALKCNILTKDSTFHTVSNQVVSS